eukprot:scaffold5606_cov30-Prasinocladus_malaysianus.AAC.2
MRPRGPRALCAWSKTRSATNRSRETGANETSRGGMNAYDGVKPWRRSAVINRKALGNLCRTSTHSFGRTPEGADCMRCKLANKSRLAHRGCALLLGEDAANGRQATNAARHEVKPSGKPPYIFCLLTTILPDKTQRKPFMNDASVSSEPG